MDDKFDQERHHLYQSLRSIKNGLLTDKNQYLIQLFHFQYKYNHIYRKYVQSLRINQHQVIDADKIPYLPISAFKRHVVKTGDFSEEIVFTSSGTSRQNVSKHYISSLDHYLDNCNWIWSKFHGPIQEYKVLALLPGYLERAGSSLIYMIQHFIEQSKYPKSDFYLYDHESLWKELNVCKTQNIPTVLFGVAYALLDFIEKFKIDFPALKIIETGGMKGQRAEISKEELHAILKHGFRVDQIYSEYGMTELLSQAYTQGGLYFFQNEVLHVSSLQINDLLCKEKKGKAGVLAVTDLSNIDGCAFIQTEDMTIVHDDERFELLGRVDHSDARGCNLLLEELLM